MLRIGSRFGRVEPRRRARAFVLGLLAGLPRKNCRTIAEHAGGATPGGMQHLLSRASWDADGVRDDLRAHVEHLGDPQAALVVDETEDVKKGTATQGGSDRSRTAKTDTSRALQERAGTTRSRTLAVRYPLSAKSHSSAADSALAQTAASLSMPGSQSPVAPSSFRGRTPDDGCPSKDDGCPSKRAKPRSGFSAQCWVLAIAEVARR